MVTGLKAPTGVSTVTEINILTQLTRPRRLVDKKKKIHSFQYISER